MTERSGILGNVAKVLNAGGSAAVAAFDFGSDALGSALNTVKKTAMSLPEEIKHVVDGGIGTVLPGEKGKLEGKIKELEKKIQNLYLEIGRESTKFTDKGIALESETVKRLLADVRGYMTEIDSIKNRIAEIKVERQAREEKGREPKEKPKAVVETDVLQAVLEAINDALSRGHGRDDAKKTAFERVARCLVGDDHGLRSLAVREMGLMKNRASVLVLSEAAAFRDPELTVDILTALAAIGDPSVIPLFEGKARNENPQVRKAALHGLYKLMAENTTALLTEALGDVNADVRATAATILGWIGSSEALSALSDRLEDKDPKVRKAALTSLADLNDKTAIRPLIRMLADDKVDVRERALEAVKTLTGVDVVFDIHASGKALTKTVEALQDWWWNKTVTGVEVPAPWEAEVGVTEETPATVEVVAEMCETAPLAEGPSSATEEAPAEPEVTEGHLTHDKLMAMRKYDLLKLCTEKGFECDVTMTKLEIANLLVTGSDQKN